MTTIKKLISDLTEIVHRRESRMDVMLEAFKNSSKEENYWELRDRLLRERGLGRIED